MKRISIVLGLAVLMAAAVVLTAGTALAQAETSTTNERIPLIGETQPEDNPCTGELITWEGTLHLVSHMTTTPDGSQTGAGNFTFKAHGVGASSGTEYVLVLSFPSSGRVVYDPNTGVYIQTNNVHTLYLNQGEGEDFKSRSVFHITQQPDGTYTAWVENSDSQCL
jgi:hypothetical protein